MRAPMINYELKVKGGLLHFILSYATPVTWHYKSRTVQETWMHSIQKILESMHCLREAISCYCELTPSIVSKNNWNTKEDKGKSMMHVLYILWLAKRHILGQSNIEQWGNQACSHIHCRVTLSWRHQWVCEWLSEGVSQHKIRWNTFTGKYRWPSSLAS